MEELYTQLAMLAQRYGARRLVLAVYGMPEQNRGIFWLEAEELPTLLKLDIVHISSGMNPEFLHNIEKDGVTLYASED